MILKEIKVNQKFKFINSQYNREIISYKTEYVWTKKETEYICDDGLTFPIGTHNNVEVELEVE